MLHELTRDAFDAVIAEHKRRLGIPLKRLFSGEQMQRVALDYQRLIQDAGIAMIEDPHDQLTLAIRTVLASWESPKACAYRRIMGISDDWGTAVAVQAMVYGNLSHASGTGVIFTHNPRWSGDVLKLWGDFTTANQGEDVVSGLVRTMPVSVFQQEIEKRDTDLTLETGFPAIYQELKRWAHAIIDEHGWSPQEIEFTFESPSAADLYMLQTRDMAIRESRKVRAFDFEGDPGERLLGHGIGVSGGAMSGRLVFSLEEIDAWRTREPRTHLILARADTVPDDIRRDSRSRRAADRTRRLDLPRGGRGPPAGQDLRGRLREPGLPGDAKSGVCSNPRPEVRRLDQHRRPGAVRCTGDDPGGGSVRPPTRRHDSERRERRQIMAESSVPD